jgi:hypothetical protein
MMMSRFECVPVGTLAVATVFPSCGASALWAAITWASLTRKPALTTVSWSAEKNPAVSPRKPQKACARCLGVLIAHVPIHCLGRERHG